MAKPQKYYAKQKKLDTKDHILYDPIYLKWPEKKSIETESRLIIAWG